jgi:hypothetical protein
MSNPFQPFFNLLHEHLDFNRSRIQCLLMLIEGLVTSRTVNLAMLSGGMRGLAQVDSHYMRLRRFMKEVWFDYAPLARLLAAIMGLHEVPRWTLILDRTNWKFGKVHINILYLAVAYGTIAIPLFSPF